MHAQPLVRFLFEQMIREQTSVAEVAQRSGVARETISRWRYNGQPNIVNLEAALRVLDYELRPVSVDRSAKISLEDRLRAAGFSITWLPPKVDHANSQAAAKAPTRSQIHASRKASANCQNGAKTG